MRYIYRGMRFDNFVASKNDDINQLFKCNIQVNDIMTLGRC